ncbi:unnamed protein product [Phytophthora fragariaefolia]|uniref:Unnamed protein product n=1 Tax=Phytophthora fragariaefolia TaxID=1490495 RepID=A0A9W6XGT2_9STRA|nr:unnamed protein product [Phytophthora fragariaefolia]
MVAPPKKLATPNFLPPLIKPSKSSKSEFAKNTHTQQNLISKMVESPLSGCVALSALSADVFFSFLLDVLQLAKFNGVQASLVAPATVETVLPAELAPFVQLYQWPDVQAALVVVATAELPATLHWELADALVAALSRANAPSLTILAALHLPYAKDGGLNVFYSGLNAEAADDVQVDVATLAAADPAWEVKVPWLAALLHFAKVEQWPRTHLLLAKGYKPGRDLAGTYEAVDALAKALQIFTKEQVTVDSQQVQRELPRMLTKEKAASSTGDEHLTLLYH